MIEIPPRIVASLRHPAVADEIRPASLLPARIARPAPAPSSPGAGISFEAEEEIDAAARRHIEGGAE